MSQRTGWALVAAPRVISMIVISRLVFASVRRWREPDVVEHERDRAIRASACRASHTVLALLAVILVLSFLPHAQGAVATPLLIAYGLFGTLILNGLFEHATSMVLYRRDRA